MYDAVFEKSVLIDAPKPIIWKHLTDTELMKGWMPDAVTGIETDWQVGSPFIIRGQIYKKPFENRGVVIAYEPEQLLAYTHLSSLSPLPDIPTSYTHFRFSLSEVSPQTELALSIHQFPTETIYRHLAFYWNVTLELMKRKLSGTHN